MINLLIVDRFRWMCGMMAAVLRDEPDIEVVGVATTGAEALAQVARCNMALISATLPDGGALALTRALAQQAPEVKVVVVDLPGNEVPRDYAEGGALAFGYEDDTVDDLLHKMRAIHNGAGIADPRMNAIVLRAMSQAADDHSAR